MLIGIIGKSNVGKSTFFKSITLAEVEIANYPFTTIKPNRGIGYVKVKCPCKEFGVKCEPQNSFCLKGNRFAPVEMLDVAGLVPGAHKGRGLGNKFLDDLRQADAFIHIVDISGSTDEEGREIPAGEYDPAKDIEFLEKEIDYWFSDIILRSWPKMAKSEKLVKELEIKLSGLGIKKEHIETAVKKVMPSQENMFEFASTLRKISKPMIIAANKIDVKGAEENLKRLERKFPNYVFVPCCAEAELALREAARKELIEYVPGEGDFKVKGNLNEEQERALNFIKEKILKKYGSTGVQNVLNKLVLEILGCVVVFPVEDENKLWNNKKQVLPDAFVLPKNSKVIDLAERIHSDFAKNFIRAIDVRKKRVVGKDHLLKNGDVIKIVAR